MPDAARPLRVYGMTRSYFTRKLTGYLDYKGLPWRLQRGGGLHPDARAAGWPGGFPAVELPEGGFMWDTTAMIHYLESRHPEPAIFPPDPLQRFLDYVIEDVADEWLYRPAVGTRWHFQENARVAGWELARDVSVELPIPCDQVLETVSGHVRSTCPPMGVDETTIDAWVGEVLRPWQRALGAHLTGRSYLFGERPALADFALFGANAAHFVADPLCRRWTEAEGMAVVTHTHRLLEPEGRAFGAWAATEDVPETLVALLADLGRLYLPWVSRATRDGAAELVFACGSRVEIAATDFLCASRATLLARYRALRSDALDAVLERAGILPYFADFTDQAKEPAALDAPPRPALNRPFPPPAA